MPAGWQLLPPLSADTRASPASSAGAVPWCRQGISFSVSRNELYVGLVLIGFANGISGSVITTVVQNGIVGALLGTFNISVIVWSACAVSIVFLLRGPAQPIERSDGVVATGALAAFVVPWAPLSWLALTGVAVHILRQSPRSTDLHRGGWILLAMTVPMFWGRLVFALLSDLILQGDAVLVGWLVGTARLGNTVQFADGSGYLWIAPACSSLANISLAILCWVTVTQVSDRPGSLRDVGWVALAISSVVAINVTRISLIGLYPEQYELLHGPVGVTVANWIILGATVGICLLGVRRERPAGA
jgi:exosortase/archaeosortase family protein